ncbi:MAG: hypothetical protein ACXWRZ_09560 [Bdellovibrio sp.]
MKLKFLFIILLTLSSLARAAEDLSCDMVFRNDDVNLQIRGGPGFVKISADKAQAIESIKKSGTLFRSSELWNLFESDSKYTEEIIELWYDFDKDFRNKIKAAYKSLGRAGILLLDPGIAQRVDQYIEYINSNPSLKNLPLIEIRQAFEKEVPSVTIWRGIVADAEEIKSIQNKGLLGNAYSATEQIINTSLASTLAIPVYSSRPHSPLEHASARLRGDLRDSLMISFSSWIEVTHVGAWMPDGGGGIRLWRPGLPFYLLKIRTSAINIIKAEGPFSKFKQRTGTYTTQGINGEPWQKSYSDPDFEIFANRIFKDEIEIIPYENRPPRWQ